MPETLTHIALSQQNNLLTHENEKSPGMAGSQVKMRMQSPSVSQLCFPLCHLHFPVCFPHKETLQFQVTDLPHYLKPFVG